MTPANREEEPPIDVSFSINGSRAASVNRDESLIMYVSLTNYEATSAVLNNESINARIEDFRKEAKERDIDRDDLNKRVKALSAGLKPVRTFRFGGRENWTAFLKIEIKNGESWVPSVWSTRLLSWAPRTSVAELDSDRICFAELGIDPEEVEKIPKGLHEVRVALELVKGFKTVSNTAMLEFTGKDTPAETRSGEGFLFVLGTYYMKRGPRDRAMTFLRDVNAAHPDYDRIVVLLGDVLEADGDLNGALELYRQALASYRKREHNRTEEPEALVARINRIQLRITGRTDGVGLGVK